MIRTFLSTLAFAALAGSSLGFAAAPVQAEPLFLTPSFQVAQMYGDGTARMPGHIRGFIVSFNQFDMTVTVHGNEIPVKLHQGTIIHPTGLTLTPHQLIRIDGVFVQGVFQADRITLIR